MATDYFVHESSYVDAPARIGKGTKIWHFCHIMPGARIGKNCVLGQNVNVAGKAVVGNNVKIQNNVSIYDGVTLEDDVFCGPSVVFTNVCTPRSHVNRREEYAPTLVKKGASLGANCTIVCGHVIGEYAFVGAGAVVTKDVRPYELVCGNPATNHGWVCACGEVLFSYGPQYMCEKCGAKYHEESGALSPIAIPPTRKSRRKTKAAE